MQKVEVNGQSFRKTKWIETDEIDLEPTSDCKLIANAVYISEAILSHVKIPI